MELAPIAVFAYNRPTHLRRSIESLLANGEAAQSDLILFSDGPRTEADAAKVETVRHFARGIRGFRSVTVEERPTNLGGPVGIPEGISRVCAQYGCIIVVEDDVVVAPFFLSFVNRALALYEQDDPVMCVSGYSIPHQEPLPSTFFLRGALNQGWATWARAWDLFEPDGDKLLTELAETGLSADLDHHAYPYTRMLRPQPDRPVPPWDVRWHASTFLREGFTLMPNASLVQNIGFDGSGAHVGVGTGLDVPLAEHPPTLRRLPLQEDPRAAKEFRRFLRRQTGWRRRLFTAVPGSYWLVLLVDRRRHRLA